MVDRRPPRLVPKAPTRPRRLTAPRPASSLLGTTYHAPGPPQPFRYRKIPLGAGGQNRRRRRGSRCKLTARCLTSERWSKRCPTSGSFAARLRRALRLWALSRRSEALRRGIAILRSYWRKPWSYTRRIRFLPLHRMRDSEPITASCTTSARPARRLGRRGATARPVGFCRFPRTPHSRPTMTFSAHFLRPLVNLHLNSSDLVSVAVHEIHERVEGHA